MLECPIGRMLQRTENNHFLDDNRRQPCIGYKIAQFASIDKHKHNHFSKIIC